MFVRSVVPVATASALVLSLISASAHAQNSLQIYGALDLAVGSFQLSNGTGVKAVTKVERNAMITSFIGFKGMEDLGGGLKAGFALESFLQPDTGATGRGPATDPFWSRSAFVYLEGGFGKFTLGRQANLLALTTYAYNPYGSAFGLSPAVRLTFSAGSGNDKGDSAWSNALTYAAPSLGGFKFTLQGQLGEDATKAQGNSYAATVQYTAGPFSAALSAQKLRSVTPPKTAFTAAQDQTFSMLGMSYDFGVAKLFGQYGKIKDTGFATNLETKLYQLGASIPVSQPGKVLVSYGENKEKNLASGVAFKHGIFSLGYDHYLSKRTDLYAVYMMDDEKRPGFKKGNTYAFGVRHMF
jgi:predicted porin